MTDAEKQILADALRAETEPAVVTAVGNRDDVGLANWCNAPTTTDAWNPAMTDQQLFEAINVTKWDALSEGKRSTWGLLFTFSPIDFSRQKMRKAVEDVWGTTDSVVVLQNCTRKATQAEVYEGGTVVTQNTVSATKLNWSGTLSTDEISDVLNNF
jgi:hypothetical protein